MTFTVRRSTAVVLITLLGVLGGLAIGQITGVSSSSPAVAASPSSEQTLREISGQLREINRAIDKSQGVFNILGEVRQINGKVH